MTTLLTRCVKEMQDQLDLFSASQTEIPQEITNRLYGLIKLDSDFKKLVNEKPWALQKISLQGIVLVKECIQRVKNQC